MVISAEVPLDESSWFSVPAARAPTVNPPIMNPRTRIAEVRRRRENREEVARAGLRKTSRPSSEYDTAASINGKTVMT